MRMSRYESNRRYHIRTVLAAGIRPTRQPWAAKFWADVVMPLPDPVDEALPLEAVLDHEVEGPDAHALDLEMREWVEQVLDVLNSRERMIITAHFFDGDTLTMIAQRLGSYRQYVARVEARALQRMFKSRGLRAAGRSLLCK